MRAIVQVAPGRLEWQELPLPAPGPGQARIRTAACGVCATDLAMIAGWDRTGCPAIPGHEWCGRVDAVGPGGDRALVGRLVVGDNVLADGGEVGFEHPGGYAECFLTEAAKLYPLPDDFAPATATLIEPLAVCVRGLARLEMREPSSALVIGDGPIGLLLVMLLRRAGVGRLVLVGGRATRVALASELGATDTLDYHAAGANLAARLRAMAPRGFANVLEASGHGPALESGLDLAASEGRVLLIGDYRETRASFRWNRLLLGELRLIGSNASAGGWPEAVRLAVSGELPLARLMTHVAPAERFEEALALHHTRAGGMVKAVLRWQ